MINIRRIAVMLLVWLTVIGCAAPPVTTPTLPPPTETPPSPTVTTTPAPTATPTRRSQVVTRTPTPTSTLTSLQAQQLSVIKELFPDYDGPDDVCSWGDRIICDEQGHIIRLEILFVGLASLSPRISELSNLTGLWIHSNELTTLPPEIGMLTNLQNLNLADNPLTSLPPEFSQLENLSILYISADQMDLLEQISYLPGLSFLSISNGFNTEPAVIPPEIGLLTQVSDLDLPGLGLTSLPPEIGSLSNLRILYLRDNELETLPPEIGNLSNLLTLDLSINPITSLPPEIGQLSNLRTLELTGAHLTSLPPELCAQIGHAVVPAGLCP